MEDYGHKPGTLSPILFNRPLIDQPIVAEPFHWPPHAPKKEAPKPRIEAHIAIKTITGTFSSVPLNLRASVYTNQRIRRDGYVILMEKRVPKGQRRLQPFRAEAYPINALTETIQKFKDEIQRTPTEHRNGLTTRRMALLATQTDIQQHTIAHRALPVARMRTPGVTA